MWLVVNAGSSSLKLALDGGGRRRVARAERIGAGGAPDHAAALAAGLAELGVAPGDLTAAAHRVVHGGPALTAPARITPDLLAAIRAAVPLAPLHNPANLTGIEALATLRPDLPQYASFDTAFHATIPEVARTYALPDEERARGLRRYGFHGLSYAGMVRTLRAGRPGGLPRRLLAYHLGNGASACAILDGRSVATTMGYSPLDGLTMGTRAGALDPGVVLDLCRRHGVEGASDLLNRRAGLLALGGAGDVRSLRAAATPEAAFALDHFAYWAVRHGGSLIAAMGGLDAIAFTGGIGENDAGLRMAIAAGLAWAGARPEDARDGAGLRDLHGNVAIAIVPADEEGHILREAQALHAPHLPAHPEDPPA
jgi:acetate kinase